MERTWIFCYDSFHKEPEHICTIRRISELNAFYKILSPPRDMWRYSSYSLVAAGKLANEAKASPITAEQAAERCHAIFDVPVRPIVDELWRYVSIWAMKNNINSITIERGKWFKIYVEVGDADIPETISRLRRNIEEWTHAMVKMGKCHWNA